MCWLFTQAHHATHHTGIYHDNFHRLTIVTVWLILLVWTIHKLFSEFEVFIWNNPCKILHSHSFLCCSMTQVIHMHPHHIMPRNYSSQPNNAIIAYTLSMSKQVTLWLSTTTKPVYIKTLSPVQDSWDIYQCGSCNTARSGALVPLVSYYGGVDELKALHHANMPLIYM